MHHVIRCLMAACAASMVLEVRSASAMVALQNPSFDDPWPGIGAGEPANTFASCTGVAVSHSASKWWTTYANTPTTSIHSWIQSAPGGFLSNLVSTGGSENGSVQVIEGLQQCEVTDVNRVGAWFYVLAGKAYIQVGAGGAGGGGVAEASTLGLWQYVSACGRPDMLNNEVVIYGSAPADFYVDDAEVTFDPTCFTCPHPAHLEGAPLSPNCGSCEATVCAIDDKCCSTAWSAACVTLARAHCPLVCP